jgi:hypothetical protein
MVHRFVLTMESLFSPCTRYRDSRGRREAFIEKAFSIGFWFRGRRDFLQELNLDLSTEELLSAEWAFTYADLYAMLGNKNMVAWLTPNAAVARGYGRGAYYWGQLDESCCFCFSADGKGIFAWARSPEHILEICDVVLRLLEASVVHSVIVDQLISRYSVLINAPTLAYLMEQCQRLKTLSLVGLRSLQEDHICVLGTYSRPGLEIELSRCKLTAAETSALAEVLGHNQGPTKLDRCGIDYSVLADGLRGNNRLKILTLCLSSNLEVGNRELLAIADALKENKGLVELDFHYAFIISVETWGAVCDSLKTHPTLQVLDLRSMLTFGDATLSPELLKTRIQALVDMLKVNMSIHTMPLADDYREHELFQGSVIPYLETNRLRPRVRAIQKNLPDCVPCQGDGTSCSCCSYRCKQLLDAFIRESGSCAFSSTTATTTPAGANLPAPATAAVTSIAGAAVAATFAVTVTATSITDVYAAANVATPTAYPKRKARPLVPPGFIK